MTFGLTPQGFRIKRLPDIQGDLQNQLVAEFGEINLDPQSVFGQFIGVFSKIYADYWENEQDVYFSQYPNSAEGISLDNVVQLNGLTRLPASQTIVAASVFGTNATLIPANSQIRIPSSNTIFYNPNDIIISTSNANYARVSATTLAPQIYTVVINSQALNFALPIVSWTNVFVPGNSIVVTVNGQPMTAVPYTIDSANTNAAIAAMILTHDDVLAVGTPNSNQIYVTPEIGKYVKIGPISVTGGASQTGYTITYDTPASLAQISQYLNAIINASSQPVTSTDELNGSIDIIADEPAVGFSISLGSNLSVTNLGSPGIFLSRDYGPIVAPANSVNEIVTPVAGWTAVNNPTAGTLGRLRETDAELRIRRQNSLRVLGAATVEAIRARLLQEVPGVTNVFIFENKTMKQEPLTVTLSTQLITGNVVAVTIDGNSISNTTYTTSHLNTMQLIANKILALPGVESVTIGGINNLLLTINVMPGYELAVDSFIVTSGASQPEIIIGGGRPPKSFEVVVQGGTDLAVAQQIWLTKPAGIQTYGNVNDGDGVDIIDSQGNVQTIYFSRAVPIYIWVDVVITLYQSESFPVNGAELVAQAILNYGNSLGIGTDVLLQRVQAQIFQVPGIANGVVQIAATVADDSAPNFGTSDIIINEDQVSVWDISRITVTVV